MRPGKGIVNDRTGGRASVAQAPRNRASPPRCASCGRFLARGVGPVCSRCQGGITPNELPPVTAWPTASAAPPVPPVSPAPPTQASELPHHPRGTFNTTTATGERVIVIPRPSQLRGDTTGLATYGQRLFTPSDPAVARRAAAGARRRARLRIVAARIAVAVALVLVTAATGGLIALLLSLVR